MERLDRLARLNPRDTRRRVLTLSLFGIGAGALPFAPACMAQGLPSGEWKSKAVDVNGLRIHNVEQGTSPLVLLCHGFPEGWFSWRHQLPALAAAGFRVVAPDLRGYGETGDSKNAADYTIKTLVADITGLLDETHGDPSKLRALGAAGQSGTDRVPEPGGALVPPNSRKGDDSRATHHGAHIGASS